MTTDATLARTPGDLAVPAAKQRLSGGMQRSYRPQHVQARNHRRFYVTTWAKFCTAFTAASLWTALSVWLSLPWIRDLAHHITLVPALLVVTFLAFVPGHLVSFLAAAVLLDRQPTLTVARPTAAATVMIAARNEAESIAATLKYLADQDYDGALQVILVDNGSTDGTADIARAAAAELGLDLTVLTETRPGKSHALDLGLQTITTDLTITVDADTLLHRSAVRILVARMESSPSDVLAVAGNVQVRNSRQNMWSRLQSWDYLLGIAAVKRVQGLFQSTLVAQGAFSLYRTDALRTAGGWPDAIGEDIVLTWHLMRVGRVFYEPLALSFTTAPATLRSLTKQRSRWARGMIEGIRVVPPWRQRRPMALALTAVDLVIPLLDIAYVLIWLPGLVLACTGRFWIVGPMTVAVVPMTAFVYWLLYRYQDRHVLRPLGLSPRRDRRGLVLFLVAYQALMSAMSLLGYGQELLRMRRAWK
ncbi:MAG TPA: glycosyltransferase [Jatrophihabitans sp.]|jgi:biofilm PGA synthesis N-glycosyltransferase PgaC